MRNEILIVDDESLNRELLAQIFEKEYDIVTACNGQEAIDLFKKHKDTLAAVLLDLIMPVVDGYQVLQVLDTTHETDIIPVILITASTDVKMALSCYSFGAAEIINKPFIAKIVHQRVANMIEVYSSRERLRTLLASSKQELTETKAQLEEFNNNLVDTISDIVEFRDMESGQHIKRVKGLTQIMAMTYAKLYPEAGLTEKDTNIIVAAAALHDIGKIAIPDNVLLKPGRLTKEEFEIMKTHTTKGCEILQRLENVQDTEHYKVAYEIVRHHHERYNGRGYPDGLKGDEIPLSAQLVSVADVYDALTSDRVYKKAFDKETAYNMIINGECGDFGPKLFETFKQSKAVLELFIDSVAKEEDKANAS